MGLPEKTGAPARTRHRLLLLLLLALGSGACRRPSAGAPPPPTAPATESAAPQVASRAPQGAKPLPPGPAEIWKEFSGEKAFEEVKKQVAVGPRPAGSPELEKARVLIEEGLRRAGWESERQVFTDETPRGRIQFSNIIGRFPGGGKSPAPTDTQRAIVCSHYDTKRFTMIPFVGASDGASSTGALLELARVLALDPALAVQVELVFFDGEEAVMQFTAQDGLYGSRHYAQQLQSSGRARQFQCAILWDMIGDADFGITLSPDSPPKLASDVLASAEALDLRSSFRYHNVNIYDDHVPLQSIARIPAIDLIDFDYPAWHTADDKLDRLDPDSLRKTGAVTLHFLRKKFR